MLSLEELRIDAVELRRPELLGALESALERGEGGLREEAIGMIAEPDMLGIAAEDAVGILLKYVRAEDDKIGAAALSGLGINDLSDDPQAVQATLVCLLKTAADQDAVPPEVLQRLIGRAA